MTHFDVTQWMDFVRGLVPDGQRQGMEEHLAGCGECLRNESQLRRLTAAMAANGDYDVPRYAVQNAKAVFPLHRPQQVSISGKLAKLVFDSFQQNQPIPGVRGEQERFTRHTLYEAGNYCVDVRLERERDAPFIILVGQVMDRNNPNAALANIPVVLFAGKRVIARALSNLTGEFQMQYRHTGSVSLHLPIKDTGNEIHVSLATSTGRC